MADGPAIGWRQVVGCDFSSAPTSRKPIVVAEGRCRGRDLHLDGILEHPALDAWGAWLAGRAARAAAERDAVVGGFDLPFGLPRELVQSLGWPLAWADSIEHFAALDRAEIRRRFAAFCAARPAGRKFAHRATDGPAGSSPSMKWVQPPVAFMLHAGVPRLRAAGWHFPAHEPGPAGSHRGMAVALEAYPALLARAVVGRQSYKSDDLARQSPDRADARRAIVAALCAGDLPGGLRLVAPAAMRRALVDDPRADRLDAVLCLVQAATAASRPRHGLPVGVDPLEGWIAGA